jgi:hypothetical protein
MQPDTIMVDKAGVWLHGGVCCPWWCLVAGELWGTQTPPLNAGNVVQPPQQLAGELWGT